MERIIRHLSVERAIYRFNENEIQNALLKTVFDLDFDLDGEMPKEGRVEFEIYTKQDDLNDMDYDHEYIAELVFIYEEEHEQDDGKKV